MNGYHVGMKNEHVKLLRTMQCSAFHENRAFYSLDIVLHCGVS